MIYFYNTIWLLLIPLSFLPIIFHLLSFKRPKKVKFTYVNILYQILKQYQPKRKLIDLIVLILRCLIIFLIIIFLARPVLYTNPKQVACNKIIFLLDNSLSMQQEILGETKLEICKKVILKLLNKLQEYNSKVKIYTFNETVKPLQEDFSLITPTLLDEIKSIKYTYMGTNLNRCLSYVLASNLKQRDPSVFKIFIFSDFADHIINENLGFEREFSRNVEVAFCYPEIVEKNRYVGSLIIKEDKDFINIESQFISNSEDMSSEAELVINDRLIDKRIVSHYVQKSKFTYLYDINQNGGFYGYIKLSSDSLMEDNIFYFTHYKENRTRRIICLINEPLYIKGFPSIKYYFEKLKIGESNIDIKNVDNTDEFNFSLDTYDVIICVGLNSLNNINIEDKNKTFIIFPGERIDLENYDLNFPGLEFVEQQESNIKEYKLNLGDIDEFNKFLEKFEYKNIYVRKRYLLTLKDLDSYRVVIKYDDNTAALLNKDNTYIFTFPIGKNYTNFIYKPLFVGLFEYILKNDEVSLKQKFKEYYFISEKIAVSNVKYINPLYSLEFSKKIYEIEEDFIRFFVPNIYEIEFLDGRKNKIAINIPFQESEINLVDKVKVKQDFSKAKIYPKFFDIRKTSIEDLLSWIFGKEISSNIVYIIALLFVIETILSRLSKRII